MLIYAATIVVAAILILRRPGTAAGVLLCTYGLEQWSQSQSLWFFLHGTVTNVVTASLVLLALAIRVKDGRPVVSHLGREFWIVFTLTLFMVASTAWSIDQADTIGQFRSEGLFYAVFVFMLPMTVSDRRDLRDACYTLITLGGALAALLLATSRWDQRAIVMETGSMFVLKGIDRGNPLSIGSFGGYVALTALLLNFSGLARVWQLVRYAIVFIGFAVTVKSGSRGQTISMLLTALTLMPLSRRVKSLSNFLTFAVSIAFFVLVASYVFDAASRDSNNYQDARWDLNNQLDAIQNARIGSAITLLSQWIAAGPFRWLFGFGSSGSFGLPGLGFYPHIVPAEVLGELGVIGAGLFVGMVYCCYRTVRELWPLIRDDPDARGLVSVAAGLFLFEFIICWKEGSLVSSNELLGFAGLLGRIALSVRREALAHAEVDAAGYAMTDEERFLEDEAYLDELYEPVPAGRA